jgi:hypothetical protein
MAAISTMVMATMAVATAVTAYGQYQAGKAQEAAYEYNAKVQEQNAKVAQDKAAYEADKQAQRVRRLNATQRAAYAASGINLSGSALDLMEDSTTQGEMDRLAILYGGNVEAANARNEATLARFQGKSAAAAGQSAAFGTLLGGASSVGMAGMRMGVWSPSARMWG